MANDSSLGGIVVPAVFDLDSQKGVTYLLTSVRSSTISKEQKNELRDLIFQYTNGGRDSGTRISLEQKINSYGLTPITPINKPQTDIKEKKEVTQYSFGTSRPAPSFPVGKTSASLSTATVEVAPTPVPVVETPPPVPEPTKPTPVVDAPATQPTPTPSQIPTPAPTPVQQEPAPQTISPAQQPKEVVPSTVSEPIPTTPTSVPVSTSAPLTTVDPNQSLARIREIKSLVNEKIGNPVNLVDIDNEVGREYMSAILDAMKKLNTGSSAVSAMKRLEDAFAQVEKTLADHESGLSQQAQPDVTPQVSASVVVPEQVIATEPSLAPKPQPATNHVPINPVNVSESAPTMVESEDTGFTTKAETHEPEVGVAKAAWGPATDTLKKSGVGLAHSLAETEVKLKTPEDLPNSADIETASVTGDVLYTKEVDDGLHQLLSEWPIFKKSGMFGTGPNGRNHPLFIKVASLQIPLLLAGRFEGSTQEIKQSITDYMNGWRYEQGIIYEHGENFEHYLRRVIRHIIDLQKKKRTS